MRFVQRNPDTGAVIGHYANENPTAIELVADDHPDLLAFHAKREANKEASRVARAEIADAKETRLLAMENRIETLETKLKKMEKTK